MKTIISLILITLLVNPQFIHARENSNTSPNTRIEDSGQFDGNRIRNDFENNGMIVSHRITGYSGMEWPKDSQLYINFASGIWIAGKVDDEIRTAVGEYGPEFVAGPWGSEPGDSEHQLYIVNKRDFADPMANDDFQNWPADLGAPWVDEDGDGVYTPMPAGEDHPEFIGDQVIWWVMNDADTSQHSIFHTLPLGIEVQMTIWGYDRPDALGDMMFVKAVIINKGGSDIDDTIIGLWADPDLGNAVDDFVGCDTTLSLGYCYNDGQDSEYGSDPPAIGYDFLQGPIVESPGDTAYAFGEYIPGYINLPMSSFVKYINGDPVYSDPNDAIEAYNYMSGFLRDGSPFVNSETGEETKFVHPDDPNDNTGVGDGVWVDSDDHASSDRRFLMNAGPFTLAAADSQEVVFGILIARGSDALSSITDLKEKDALAQLAYDIHFEAAPAPSPPIVEATALSEEIVLTWDDAAESYIALDEIDLLPVPFSFDTTYATGWFEYFLDLLDPVVVDSVMGPDSTWIYNVQYVDAIDTTFSGEPTEFRFEGYTIYQLESPDGMGEKMRVATFDLINGVTEIEDDIFDPNYGEMVNVVVQFGSDSGVRRYINITSDKFNDNSPLMINTEYYFSVTAYGYNQYGIPKTLESDIQPIITVPLGGVTGIDYSTVSADSAQHISGNSDGSVLIEIIDPLQMTDHTYQVTFRPYDDSTSTIVWDLFDMTEDDLVYDGCPIQSGLDLLTGLYVGEGVNPIIDGVQIQVGSPIDEFSDFYATHNASGEIDGYAGAAADWQEYPGMGRDNIGNQQTNGSTWFITTSNGDNVIYEDFYPYVTRYSGGYGNPDGGMQYLTPDDFEFRFTETGSKMLNRGNDLVVDTPLEIWNIGEVNDPSDDFQMMGLFNDSNEDGEWNMYQDDSPVSGGNNDPYMEGFYVVEHKDREPGTAGYEAMVDTLTADPGASGDYIWATGPGLPLSVPGQITRVVLLNMTFANWNGGDVTADPFVVDAAIPETGTVFRIATTKPNSVEDVFTFTTSGPTSFTVEKGDVNLDSLVNISDAVMLISFLLQVAEPTSEQEYASDFNSDMFINISDVVALINSILGQSARLMASLSDAESAYINLPEKPILSEIGLRLPVEITADGALAALQIELNYDSEILDPLSPTIEGEEWNGINVLFHSPTPGKVVYLFYSLNGAEIPIDSAPLFEFRNISGNEKYSTKIKLSHAVVANPSGISASVEFGNTLSKSIPLPETYAVHPNYPNPFNPITYINYDLPEMSVVNIEIFNILGQRVRTLMSGSQVAGHHRVQWNGKNNFDKALPSGVYLVKFKANHFDHHQKIMLLK